METTKEKTFEEMTNQELVNAMSVLSKNNDVLREEVTKLLAVIQEVQSQWYKASEILNKRMGIKKSEGE